ncbi:MAG TPA: alpha/beta family hydrolase [Chloroflexia bacterium]|nr:alpha/beta family hydrolase [Chloroflexia bacterium]
MYSGKTLPIIGYRNLPVPHTFLQQARESRQLLIVLPGRGYTCDMPLLYYSTRFLLTRGMDVLQVEYGYHKRPDFGVLPATLQDQWLYADAVAACAAALAQRAYESVTLIGKSLGTQALAHLLITDARLAQAQAVWLTPLLRNETARAQIARCRQRSLFVIGTADPHYDPQHLAEVQGATDGEVLVIPGANHSLEIEGKVWQSLEIMERVVRAIQKFVA